MNNSRASYRILNLSLTETAGSQDMFVRPYTCDVNDEQLGQVERASQAIMDNHFMDASAVEKVIDKHNIDLLNLDSNNVVRADIINDWGTKRFTFELLLEVRISGMSSTRLNLVKGFSEYLDVDHLGNPSGSTKLHITSISILHSTTDQYGNMQNPVVIGNYGVSFDETGRNANSNHRVSVVRPAEILTRISVLADMNGSFSGEIVTNAGNLNEIQLTDMGVISPRGHVASTLAPFINSSRLHLTHKDAYTDAIGDTLTDDVQTIDFFKLLYAIYNETSISFTLDDISYIDPNHAVPNVFISDGSALVQAVGMPTHGAEYATKVMNMTLTTIHELLNLTNLQTISFAVTNSTGFVQHTITGVPTSIIPNLDVMQYGSIFLDMFIKKIWSNLTNNGMTQITLSVVFLGDGATISITVDNSYEYSYVIPNFAVSKIFPINMTTDGMKYLSKGYKDVLDTTSGVVTHYKRSSFKQLDY